MRTFEGIRDIEVDVAKGISVPGNKAEKREFTVEFAPVMASLDESSRLKGKSGSIIGANSRNFRGKMRGVITCSSFRFERERRRNNNIRVKFCP